MLWEMIVYRVRRKKKQTKIILRHSLHLFHVCECGTPTQMMYLQPFSLHKYTIFTRVEESELAFTKL